MIKIIVTGYPSVQNAVEAVNRGADGFVTKPVNVENLLSNIKEHLKKQEESRHYDEERMQEFVESRLKEQDSKKKMDGHVTPTLEAKDAVDIAKDEFDSSRTAAAKNPAITR
jgi:DNA-binding NtrC family response regulator